MTLLEMAEDGGRNFALIHFSGPDNVRTDLFIMDSYAGPGRFRAEDKMKAAQLFLGGGTDFETPMNETLALIKGDDFENADIVFITDGECELSADYLERSKAEQAARHFTATGILLDKGKPGMDFSLTEFCQEIYRTSEQLGMIS